MQTIRAILIDDENHCVETLRYELDRHCPGVVVIATCSSGAEGLKALEDHPVDLIFLDVEMPGMNGFEMLRRCRRTDFAVIFTTAFDQYAIQAFRFAAIDYLLKPIISSQLIEAVSRVASHPDRAEHIATLLQNLHSTTTGHSQKIALPTTHGLDFVRAEDILRCESESNYTHVFLTDGRKYLLSRTLKELEQMLGSLGFYRCHQSHLIQINHVQRFMRTDGGFLVLTDGARIPVAKRKKEECLALLKGK